MFKKFTMYNESAGATDHATEIADYIYISMCVDGCVKFDSFIDNLDMVRHGKKLTGMLFEVTDKRRGKFYIGWMV